MKNKPVISNIYIPRFWKVYVVAKCNENDCLYLNFEFWRYY